MKLGGIARFELAYQLRRPQSWLFMAAPAAAAFLFTRDGALADALYADFFLNSPFVIASATVFGSLFWFLVAAAVAGEAAARDVEEGMHPLTYTAPVSKAEYLGGRFLAAFVLHALILLEAEPLHAVDDLHGRIWRRVISKEELPELEREHAVISTKLLAGRTVVRVYSDTAPGPGFEAAEPDLEDVYFSAMAGHIGRRRERPAPPEPAVAP